MGTSPGYNDVVVKGFKSYFVLFYKYGDDLWMDK